MKHCAAALGAAVLLSACAGDPDPWSAEASYAAAAQPGVVELLRTHAQFTPTEDGCAIEAAPAIEIVQDGTIGALSVAPVSEVIALPDTPCDGEPLDGVGVYYEAPAGASGFDTVVYGELRSGPSPDTLYTATIRVR